VRLANSNYADARYSRHQLFANAAIAERWERESISDNDRRSLQQRIAPELRDQKFGNATLDLVMIWQGLVRAATL
jgi:hypothetical protein